jgi:competence protein ComEC
MVRISAFLVAGILVAIYFPDLLTLKQSAAVFGGLSVSYLISNFLLPDKWKGASMGFIGLLAIAFLGHAHLKLKTDSYQPTHLLNVPDAINAYAAIVRSAPESKVKSWKIEVEVIAIKTKQWHDSKGKVLLYVSKKAGDIGWQYGDRLLINGAPQPLKAPANPGEFDIRRYVGFKNIFHQQYVLPQDVKWVASGNRKGFIYYSHKARKWALEKLNKYVPGQQEQAIAAALVLGVTDGIDTDLQNAYAASGAMHVLAVSGLHVGIIYGMLLLILKPISKYKWSAWAVALISLLSLWGFAFVTGLSPSVLRAVTMFSFVAVARPFGQRTNIYNTLAASAFVLLLYNPYLLMSVGFQLSYLAVLGIVYLQRPIYNLWEAQTKMGDWVWRITCVSIAAQIATFALGLLYFHQFPVYFLISNLFVIPLSTGILILGVVLLGVAYISPVAWVLGKILTFVIFLLNQTVFLTEKLPYSLINGIYISTVQCLLLMAVLIAIIFLFEFRKVRWLYVAAIFAIIFSAIQWHHFGNDVSHKQFVVYAISGHAAVEQIEDGNSIFYADSALLGDEERMRFHIKPNRLKRGVANTEIKQMKAKNKLNGMEFFYWNGKSIAMVNDRQLKWPQKLVVDIMVISQNSFPINKMNDQDFKIGTVVLDGTNTRTYSAKMIKFASSRNTVVHWVEEKGAFILTD